MGSPWKALADDNRREMLILLRDGEKTPSEISENFDFTFPAVSTHLRVLKDAGLVVERKEGKNRLYSLKKEGMSELARFFDSFWDVRLDKLKQHVETRKKGGT